MLFAVIPDYQCRQFNSWQQRPSMKNKAHPKRQNQKNNPTSQQQPRRQQSQQEQTQQTQHTQHKKYGQEENKEHHEQFAQQWLALYSFLDPSHETSSGPLLPLLLVQPTSSSFCPSQRPTPPEQQELAFQSYLKQYESLTKISKKQQAHHSPPQQQMQDLISEFLADIPPKPSASKHAPTKEYQSQGGQLIKNHRKEQKVTVQKIDLNQLKARSQSRSPAKENKNGNGKKVAPIKKELPKPKDNQNQPKPIEITIISKKQASPSPRFGNTSRTKGTNSRIEGTSNKSRIEVSTHKTRGSISGAKVSTSKSPHRKEEKMTIHVIKVNKNSTQPSHLPLSSTSQQQHTPNRGNSPTRPSKQTYLQQNKHKIVHRPQQIAGTVLPIRVPSPPGRSSCSKPLKIDIDIAVQDFASPLRGGRGSEFEPQQASIIKQVTQRVLTLLHKAHNHSHAF